MSVRTTVAFSIVQVGGLAFMAAVGVPHLGDHSLTAGMSLHGVVGGAALVFFAFIGFDEVITLSSETRDPVRTVPKGLLFALGISTVLYALVSVAGVSVLGADALARADQPLAAVMETAVGGVSTDLVATLAMIATTNTPLLLITASSRLLYGMAERSALPPAFHRTSRHGVPGVGVAVALGGALVGVVIGNLTFVASVTDFAVYLVFVAVNLVVIVLRYRQPRRFRPFRVPFNIGRVPVPAVGALIVVVILIPGLDPAAIAVGLVLAVLGLLTHLALERWGPAKPESTMPSVDDGGMHRRHVTAEEITTLLAALRLDLAAVEWDLEQLKMGIHSELQHGRVDPDTNITDDDLIVTAKIALAHLNEIPDYYTRLATMEAQAFDEQAHHRPKP